MSERVQEAREAVLGAGIVCECGHSVAFHGEGYEDYCTADGCQCSHNAADAHAFGKIPEAVVDALIAAVREDALRRVREGVEAMVKPDRTDHVHSPCCPACEDNTLREVLALLDREAPDA